MIIKIDKGIKELSIALLGFRHQLLVDLLEKNNLTNYKILSTYEEIDETSDIVFLSGVHYIVPEVYLNKPKYGVYCFHESPLPEGRGSAPIHWAVSNNRPNLTVSLFQANAKIDKGFIVTQVNVPITITDVYEDLENKRLEGIKLAFEVLLEELSEGCIVLRRQTGSSSYNKKRSITNSELDVNKTLAELWNHIRVCDNDKFPAYFKVGDKKIIINYKVEDDSSN